MKDTPLTYQDTLVTNLKSFFAKVKKQKAVLGLSGGIDSAVTLSLTVKALGSENVTALFMPEEGLTSDHNRKDALELAEQAGVEIKTVPIDAFLHPSKQFPWIQNKIAAINSKPRIRMLILYNYANAHDAIVVGTSNKSEIFLGYGTKHGDCAADVLPLGDLYKTEVFQLARELGIPPSIIEKTPSAELYAGQTDEDEMGITYPQADLILKDIVDARISPAELLKKFPQQDVTTALQRYHAHEHKRVPIPVIPAIPPISIISPLSSDKIDKIDKTALFIGRFQPFHLGHADAFQQIAQDCSHIIIAVGSSQYSNTEKNPFPFEQRQEMISKAISVISKTISYGIVPIEDIHDDRSWVDHVNKAVPSYDLVFTSNPHVSRLFNEKNIPVRPLVYNVKISGQNIRELIAKGDSWKQFVPEETILVMENYLRRA